MDKAQMHLLNADEINKLSVPTFIAEQPADDMEPTYLSKLEAKYGFMYALMGSSATNSLFTTDNGKRVYRHVEEDCDTGEYKVLTGKTIWTELPEDIGIACCHTKPDLNGCLTYATPKRLCLRDCFDDMTEHFRRLTAQGISLFGGRGSEAEYMAELKAWFIFFQARDIMYGQMGVTGNNIPEFPGVLDMMQKAVTSFSGTDIIGAFEQIGCRLDILGGNYVFGAHPMTINSLKKAVNRGGIMYRDWSVNNGTLYFKRYPFYEDINIPINLETGLGQIWAADLDKAGIFMERNLSDPVIDWYNNYQDSTTGDCFNKCVTLRNYGFAFTKDFNAIFRITDVPLNGACLGEKTLMGLGSLIEPDTLIPTYA